MNKMSKKDSIDFIRKGVSLSMLNLIIARKIHLKEEEDTQDVRDRLSKVDESLFKMEILFKTLDLEKIRKWAPTLHEEFSDHKQFFENKLQEIPTKTFKDYRMVLSDIVNILGTFIN